MPNKYNAKSVYYNKSHDLIFESDLYKGVSGFERFDSKFELSVYRKLLNITSNIKRQVSFDLYESRIVIDFLLCAVRNGKTCFIAIEAKGFETQIWKFKRKQFISLYPDIWLIVIRNNTEISDLSRLLNGIKFSKFTEVTLLTDK